MFSVVILTKNEESRLRGCLESAKWADEIIIIDSGSTDKTLEIAKKYTGKIFTTKEADFSVRRNLGFEKSKGDWVLYLDSDERILSPLREEIVRITQNSDKSAFALSRINIIFGKKVNYGPYKKDWIIRLLKRDKFETWIGRVHEYAKFKGELGYSKNSLLHLTHRDIDQFVSKSLEWSKIDAKLRLEANHPKMTAWRFLRIYVTETINQLFKRKGILGGTIGVIDSILQAFSLYITYVRLWQLQQPESLEKIYNDLDRKLIEDGFIY